MARYSTSESSSDLSSDESRDSVNCHSASEEEVEVAEVPAFAVEEKDDSDINGGNLITSSPFRFCRTSRRN